jgi:subtilisin family serine protease
VHPVIERRRRRNDRWVKVAVLDTGIEKTHPRITASLQKNGSRIKDHINWTTSGSSSDTTDKVGHGTAVSELLLRVAKVELYVGKVFNSREGDENVSEIISKVKSPHNPSVYFKFDVDVFKAIDHASVTWDVRIIVMSFGFLREDDRIRTAIAKATSEGRIIFAAASNRGSLEGIRRVAFPARMGQVISINSSDGYGSKSRFTPFPKDNDDNFSTIGEALEVAWPINLAEGGLRMTSGTSLATPIAAGIAALVLEFVSQRGPEGFDTITNVARLFHYDGMRAILSSMCGNPLDGYHWIQPWNLFSKRQLLEDNTYEDIARTIAYELENL